MKLQYLRAFIVLLAGLITLIINMKLQKNVISSLLILLIVILVFYVIGTLIVEILQKALEPPKKMEVHIEGTGEEDKKEDAEKTDTESNDMDFDEDE